MIVGERRGIEVVAAETRAAVREMRGSLLSSERMAAVIISFGNEPSSDDPLAMELVRLVLAGDVPSEPSMEALKRTAPILHGLLQSSGG